MDVQAILSAVPKQRRTGLFSATLTTELQRIMKAGGHRWIGKVRGLILRVLAWRVWGLEVLREVDLQGVMAVWLWEVLLDCFVGCRAYGVELGIVLQIVGGCMLGELGDFKVAVGRVGWTVDNTKLQTCLSE